MRVIIALAVLVCLSLGGCSRANQAGLREASTSTAAAPDQGEFSETGSATCEEASRSDQCDRSATASATCQEASGTDQNEFGEFACAAT
jgi:hypothetical protein